MALTKIGKEGITGISNASDATAITIDASENVGIGNATPSSYDAGARQLVIGDYSSDASTGMTISGSTNNHIYFADGTSGDAAYRGSIAYNHTGDYMLFRTGGFNERMRIDSSGNAGIGTTVNALFNSVGGTTKLAVTGSSSSTDILGNTDASIAIINTDTTANNTAGLHFARADTDNNPNYAGASIVAQFLDTQATGQYPRGQLAFLTSTTANAAPSEKMRIASDGAVSIGGTTATAAFNLVGTGGSNVQIQNNIAAGTGTIVSIGFINDNGLIGSIQSGGSSTSYETSSDYRLKENVDYTWDATTRLKQLKPARFNFIADDTNTLVDGFLAHEVSLIVPEAISGAKDAMAVETRYTADDVETQGDTPSKNVDDPKTYSDTKIDPQGIDQSKLVPLLVKTIQELEARLTAGGL